MTETLTALEVCCCGNCEASGHQKEVIRPLTAQEIAQREKDAKAFAEEKAKEEADAKALAKLKASAKAKLISGTPLTEEEASVLVM
jgi:membrane protein involved in colicin uptake